MDVQHYFIYNPAAGVGNAKSRLQQELLRISPLPYTLLITDGPGEARQLAREILRHEKGPVRIYACGGDGTLGEVAQAVSAYPNAAVGVWPCGSGNDFARYYGGADRFLDLTRQVNASTVLVDLIKVKNRASINVVNLGLEAEAARIVTRLRDKPLLGGKKAYWLGVLGSLSRHMRTSCKVVADGQVVHEGDLLTLSLASGRYVGGGFQCAPQAINDDGLMDICIVLPVSRLKLARMIKRYQAGLHLTDPEFAPIVRHFRAKEVSLTCKKEVPLCLDGEISMGKEFQLSLLPRAVRFILPEAEAAE